MKFNHSAFTSFGKFFVLFVIAATPCVANAQVFTDEAEWEAALCGEVVSDELNFGQVTNNFTELDQTLATAWGAFDIASNDVGFGNAGFNFDASGNDNGLAIDPNFDAALIPNPALGEVEGFSFGYATSGATVCVTLEDATVVEVVVPVVTGDPTVREFVGWVNNTGLEVVGITAKADEEPSVDALPGLAFFEISLSFKNEVVPAPVTCQSQLQDVIDALVVKLDSASENDRYWIEYAIYELECAHNPYFWETEDRLSDLGSVFFGHNFYATYFLQCVADQDLVEDCLVRVQDLLGCVVEAEVAFAIQNPDASTNLLAYAEEFEAYADAFADAELYLSAVLLHFYAWLFANNA